MIHNDQIGTFSLFLETLHPYTVFPTDKGREDRPENGIYNPVPGAYPLICRLHTTTHLLIKAQKSIYILVHKIPPVNHNSDATSKNALTAEV
jgi:hypothetical protein